jgi:hypothetical protein
VWNGGVHASFGSAQYPSSLVNSGDSPSGANHGDPKPQFELSLGYLADEGARRDLPQALAIRRARCAIPGFVKLRLTSPATIKSFRILID